jgi:hypothetical protein
LLEALFTHHASHLGRASQIALKLFENKNHADTTCDAFSNTSAAVDFPNEFPSLSTAHISYKIDSLAVFQ